MPDFLPDEVISVIRNLHAEGVPVQLIAQQTGASRASVYRLTTPYKPPAPEVVVWYPAWPLQRWEMRREEIKREKAA
jgi:DNA invertase Pin-like site-specific DNA recombinase